MPTDKTMLTVTEVLALQPGDEKNATWINPGFIAYVKKIVSTKAKTSGKQMHICTLCDPDGSYELGMTIFTPTINFVEGDTIEVSGKGLRRTEYNGIQQATIGQATEIHVVQAPHHAPPARRTPLNDERGGNPPPPPPPADEATSQDGDRALAFHQKMKANAVLYLQCLSYARNIQTTLKAGNFPEMAPDHFQACVSTLFIAGDRQGLGVMPPPFEATKPAAPEGPRQAPPPAPKTGRPQPGPDNSVRLEDDPGEDVPF